MGINSCDASGCRVLRILPVQGSSHPRNRYHLRSGVNLGESQTSAKSAAHYKLTGGTSIIKATIAAFDPQHAVVTSHEYLSDPAAKHPWDRGWFTYERGGDPPTDPDYFVPLHVAHLSTSRSLNEPPQMSDAASCCVPALLLMMFWVYCDAKDSPDLNRSDF